MDDIYESEDAVCVVEPKQKHAVDHKRKLKNQPEYMVIIHNDDDHTVEYVMVGIIKVFGYSPEKAFMLTKMIDEEDRAAVWTGTKELAELKCDQIKSLGPDMFAAKPVEYSLGVSIEPIA